MCVCVCVCVWGGGVVKIIFTAGGGVSGKVPPNILHQQLWKESANSSTKTIRLKTTRKVGMWGKAVKSHRFDFVELLFFSTEKPVNKKKAMEVIL